MGLGGLKASETWRPRRPGGIGGLEFFEALEARRPWRPGGLWRHGGLRGLET